MIYNLLKKKNKKANIKAETKQEIVEQIGGISSIGRVKSRDPVYDLHDRFSTDFDEVGNRLSQQKINLTSDIELKLGKPKKVNGDFYREFAGHAFNKGRLSSAIMDGETTAKVMFMSCLKRTLSYGSIKNTKDQELTSSSTIEPLENENSKVIFNQYATSAVGIVIDSTTNATKALSIFSNIARGKTKGLNQLGDIDTLYKLYPFLDTENEEYLLEKYENELMNIEEENLGKKAALIYGIDKLNALIHKKQSLKSNFLFKITEILEKSQRAKILFESEQFVEDVTNELTKEFSAADDDNNNENSQNKIFNNNFIEEKND